MEDIFVSAFEKILNMSITGGYIILAVMIARLILRSAPKKYSYALWAVALFRLICPVSFKSVISVFALKPFDIKLKDTALSSQTAEIVHIPENIGLMAQPEIQTGISAVDAAVNESLPVATPMYSANPLQIWEFFGMLLWIVGIAALLAISFIGLWRLCRRLRTATLLEGNVWQSENVQSPFIIGFFKPKIYIPYGLEGAALGYVLAHERAHIKRGDHVIRTLAYLVLCLHWFNPLVWLAFWLAGRDMELSCDEKVLGRMGGRAEYSETLLSFASPRRFPAPTPLAFGESGVARRIKNALKWKRPRLWVSAIALVLCAVVIVACAANPKDESEQPSVSDKAPDSAKIISPWKLLTELDENNVSSFGITTPVVDADISISGIRDSFIDALKNIRPEEIKVGRGIPWKYSIDIGYGPSDNITLGYGGRDFVELQLSEDLKEMYHTERGVWEIHNDALTELMAGLEAEPFAEFDDTSPSIATVGIKEQADCYLHFQSARIWTGDGWLYSDGIPLASVLEEPHVSKIPTVSYSPELEYKAAYGIRKPIEVYDENMIPVQNGNAEEYILSDLAPGTYYCVFTVDGPPGKVIPGEGEEYIIYKAIFRLVVD